MVRNEEWNLLGVLLGCASAKPVKVSLGRGERWMDGRYTLGCAASSSSVSRLSVATGPWQSEARQRKSGRRAGTGQLAKLLTISRARTFAGVAMGQAGRTG
jgi:hypothetical protein